MTKLKGICKYMQWLKVTIYTTADGIDSVCGRLYNLGITGTEIEDFDDFTNFLDENKDVWDYVDQELIDSKKSETKVICYVSGTPDGIETLADIKGSLKELKDFDKEGAFGRLEIDETSLDEEDWANNWKQYFHPLEIGGNILVCPQWEVPEEQTRMIFKINPGMTFGTGSHHTTKLCIEKLEKYIKDGNVMADLGCGSGILSLISLMLGASHATAVDIDPNAVKIAYDNADINNVCRENLRVLSGNVLDQGNPGDMIADRKYDVVCANIVADVIIALLPFALRILKDDGVFITSGIILDRKEDVKLALVHSGFEIVEENISGEWLCFVCRKAKA